MPRVKSQTIAEFGDFQTPPVLAARCCALLQEMGVKAASIVEPTCGRGSFLFAAADRWPSARVVEGTDVNPSHLASATAIAREHGDFSRFSLECADFFRLQWSERLARLPEPILVIGNPPWVTNAEVSSLGGSNVPEKSNFQGHDGFDAITGKANFDISEWMLIKVADALNGRDAVLAMLVKNVVARKLLYHCWKRGYSLSEASMFSIDAPAHFNAAVDASLITLRFGLVRSSPTARVYGQLSLAIPPIATIALVAETVVADLDAYEQTKHLNGSSMLKWRSGIKHDCSRVMELRHEGQRFRNGLGQIVDLEPDYLFPMLKSSQVARGARDTGTRWMLVPQRRIGQSTTEIAERAPKTWQYLQTHRGLLGKRGSSIYRDKPDFSIFGVGEYSFSPWKVAISGMYKSLRFVKVGTHEGKPIVFDDTANFLPCPSEAAADLVLTMLESTIAQTFYRAFVFWDAKRPVTIELLARLNFHALASELELAREFETHFGPESNTSPKGNQMLLAFE
jgi:methylase of polypeptide subunit release factors